MGGKTEFNVYVSKAQLGKRGWCVMFSKVTVFQYQPMLPFKG